MPLARSQVIKNVASPRKRGAPAAASDCPGSQNLASPLTARLFNPRSASAPPSAAMACLMRSPGLLWARAGGTAALASNKAVMDKVYFMGAPPLYIVELYVLSLRPFKPPCVHPRLPSVRD